MPDPEDKMDLVDCDTARLLFCENRSRDECDGKSLIVDKSVFVQRAISFYLFFIAIEVAESKDCWCSRSGFSSMGRQIGRAHV